MQSYMLILTWLAIFLFGLIVGVNKGKPVPDSNYVYVLLIEVEDKEYIPLSIHDTITECVEESFRIKEEGDFFMCEKIDPEATL